jgi:general secretion pathway protein A
MTYRNGVPRVMETYRHFGLSAPPFNGPPDPRFFYGTPSYAETLATLQYAVHSGKACTLVLGESGSGKTLLGQTLVESSGARSDVLWVHGLGQPAGDTMASVLCAPGGLASLATLRAKNVPDVPLAEWLRTARPVRPPRRTLLVVDDADGLRPNAWESILSLVTRETPPPIPVTAVLFGLPTLLDTLATPALVRLQRRLFRVCRLLRLTGEEVTAYVRHRIRAAGGQAEVFTASALALIDQCSEGNPALINQLCDNALVEAFGDDCRCVDAPHVLAAVRGITGEADRPDHPVDPVPEEHAYAAGPPIPDESLLIARLRSIDGPVVPRGPHDAAVVRPSAHDRLRDRLHSLQSRLSEAFSRVRSARQWPGTGDTPAADTVSETATT